MDLAGHLVDGRGHGRRQALFDPIDVGGLDGVDVHGAGHRHAGGPGELERGVDGHVVRADQPRRPGHIVQREAGHAAGHGVRPDEAVDDDGARGARQEVDQLQAGPRARRHADARQRLVGQQALDRFRHAQPDRVVVADRVAEAEDDGGARFTRRRGHRAPTWAGVWRAAATRRRLFRLRRRAHFDEVLRQRAEHQVVPLAERHLDDEHRDGDHQVDDVQHVGRPGHVEQAEQVEHDARERGQEEEHQERPVAGVRELVVLLLLLQPAAHGQQP